jgi:hypothetical protein
VITLLSYPEAVAIGVVLGVLFALFLVLVVDLVAGLPPSPWD